MREATFDEFYAFSVKQGLMGIEMHASAWEGEEFDFNLWTNDPALRMPADFPATPSAAFYKWTTDALHFFIDDRNGRSGWVTHDGWMGLLTAFTSEGVFGSPACVDVQVGVAGTV